MIITFQYQFSPNYCKILMAQKEELHTIIQSLTRSEKRYFKLFCKRESSGSNYLKLFDAIDQQEEYDEAEIREKFKEETFVRQLHVTKNYLQKVILKSLRNYHSGVSKKVKVNDLLQNVEILFSKELYELALRQLKKTEKIAGEFELLNGLIEVGEWKRKIVQVLNPNQIGSIQEAIDMQGKTIERMNNKNEYWRLASGFTKNFFIGGNGKKNHPLLEDSEKALTLEAKVLYFNTNYLRYLQENNHMKAEESLQKLVKMLEEQPIRMQEDPSLYISSLNNLLSYLVFDGRYKEALEQIQKAKGFYEGWQITSENRPLVKQMLRTLNIEMEIYRDKKMFDEKIDFIENTEDFLTANEARIPREYLFSFWFQLASIHFMRKDFRRALQWNNRLLNSSQTQVRSDLHIQCRMLNLMIHLEQKNLTVLRYYVDSSRRFMKRMKEVHPFEKVLFRFFVKIGRIPESDFGDAFRELNEQLFFKDGESLIPSDALGYIDYKEWIEGKLNGGTVKP